MKQLTLFVVPRPSRARPRKLMHVIDAGPDDGDWGPGQIDRVRFGCGRCGHETDWQPCLASIAKRGVPCPHCNPDPCPLFPLKEES